MKVLGTTSSIMDFSPGSRLMTAEPTSGIVVDLTGLGALPPEIVETLARAQASGCEVEVLNPSLRMQEVLRDSGLNSILIRGSHTAEPPI